MRPDGCEVQVAFRRRRCRRARRAGLDAGSIGLFQDLDGHPAVPVDAARSAAWVGNAPVVPLAAPSRRRHRAHLIQAMCHVPKPNPRLRPHPACILRLGGRHASNYVDPIAVVARSRVRRRRPSRAMPRFHRLCPDPGRRILAGEVPWVGRRRRTRACRGRVSAPSPTRAGSALTGSLHTF